jgi:MYXO-CTERM domain-containing protein
MRYALLTLIPLTCPAASITIERVSVFAQSAAAFGTTGADLLGPIELRPDTPNSAMLDSATGCLAGTPGCPTAGSSIRAGRTRVRFTNVDIACNLDEDCSSFGVGFSFSGVVDGLYIFQYQLANVETEPLDAGIRGNLSLELRVGSVYTNRFLTFDTSNPATWGPTASIPVRGRSTDFTAFGTLIIFGMPANSRFRLLHSAEFDFESVPEPSTRWLGIAGLAAIGAIRRRR